jgi:Tol biopolymer transport system component
MAECSILRSDKIFILKSTCLSLKITAILPILTKIGLVTMKTTTSFIQRLLIQSTPNLINQAFWLLLVFFSSNLYSQNLETKFGKNRVQYHSQFEDWLYYESPNFTTYWYGAARNVGQAALQIAESDFMAVQQSLEYPLSEKIEIIVYGDLTDLKQSNIGEDELFQTKSGESKVVGNKVFVFFDGNHQHLRAQIREGIAGVILNSMLFGSSLQEIVQNAVLLNLPPWFTEGLVAFCGENWNANLDNDLRDLILSGKYKKFDKLAKANPRLAGHAFWYYINLHYGKSTVSTLLYLTRINRSVDGGFFYGLGNSYEDVTTSLMDYYKKRYQSEGKNLLKPEKSNLISFKNRKKSPISQLKISPDGRRIVWVSNQQGKWRVWLKNLETEKQTLLMKGGTRDAIQATDYNYPLLAWNPDNQRLAIAYEKRDVIKLAIMEAETKKNKEIYNLPKDFQRLYSIDFAGASDLVFSAAQSGFSDLFLYHTVTKSSERLTQDFWDDLDASVVNLDNQLGVLFASNRLTDTLSPLRMDTILPTGNFDIFYYDLIKRSNELVRITETPTVNERHPIGVDSAYFAFISEENGVQNRQMGFLKEYIAYYQKIFYLNDGALVKAAHTAQLGEWSAAQVLAKLPPADTIFKNLDKKLIDSAQVVAVVKKRPFTYNQTNLDRNILAHTASSRTLKKAEIIKRDEKYSIYVENIQPLSVSKSRFTRYRELTLRNLGIEIPKQDNVEEIIEKRDTTQKNALNDPLDGITFRELQDTVKSIKPEWTFQLPDSWNTTPTPKSEKPKAESPEKFEEMEVIRDKPLIGNFPLPEGQNEVVRFNQSRIIPYRLKFRTDNISTNTDNSLLFEGLDSYAGSPNNNIQTPPMGVLMKANFKDLMEDYVLETGFRLPISFDGAEYYMLFDNKKYRLDKRIAFYRKTKVTDVNNLSGTFGEPNHIRNNTFLGQYELKYPLSHFFSLRSTFTMRQDKARLLTTDQFSLDYPDFAEQRASVRLAAVYDNTVDLGLNLKSGSRAKIWVEGVKKLELNVQPKVKLNFNAGWMGILALDARHYHTLDKKSILALRLAGATTFGSERILYFLGGVEDDVLGKFNPNIPVPESNDFAYKTIAGHVRGFRRNIRNGNSFALCNVEARVPLFRYLSSKPTMGNFWKNFQVVGFFDAGTAWQGKDPYSTENPLNTVYLENPPTVFVKVNYFRDPLVAGYGVGARMTLFGMFARLDYAWGIETRVVQKPIIHVSIGTDF